MAGPHHVLDGTAFSEAGEGGGGGGSVLFRYTNLSPMPEDVGGLNAGTTFVSRTMKQMFDDLLYPYQAPSFLTFTFGQASPVEVGVTLAGVKTFTWTTENDPNIVANNITIRDITGVSDLATGLVNDGTEDLNIGSVQKVVAASNVWQIEGKDTEDNLFTRNLTIQWQWRLYFGTQAAATLSEAQIEALVNSPLAASFAGTHSFVVGDYKYICYADSLGSIATVKDNATLFNVPMADAGDDAAYSFTANGLSYAKVSVTNTEGITEDYRVYRTKNVLGAAIALIVT